jgi:hypothetical protein
MISLFGLSHFLGGLIDCFNDLHIARAPAEIAGDGDADFLFGRGRVVIQQISGTHEHPGRTEPAMNGFPIKKRFLQGRKGASGHESFYRSNFPPLNLWRQDQTRIDGNAIQQDSARAALSYLTPAFRSGQPECVTQKIKERLVWRNLQRVRPAVDRCVK